MSLRIIVFALMVLGGCARSAHLDPISTSFATTNGIVMERIGCVGTLLPVITATKGHSPYVELEVAGNVGLFLIDYGASQSVLEDGVWDLPPKPGDRWTKMSHESTDGIDLVSMGPHNIPGWASVERLDFQIVDRNLTVAGHGPQVGVITPGDLLFNQSVEFHFGDAGQVVFVSDYGEACSPEQFAEAGMRLIDQTGHWENGEATPDGIFNGPVLHVAFETNSGEVTFGRTFAQFDTGLDDQVWDRTIIVNRALLDELKSAEVGPVLQGRSTFLDCEGEDRMQEVYLHPNHSLRIEDGMGKLVHKVDAYTLLFQDSAGTCGGITAHNEPAAQLGASFLREFGTTAFVGQRKEVWVKQLDK